MKYELDNSILYRVNHTANVLNNYFNQELHIFNIAIEQRVALEYIKNMKSVNQTKIAEVLAKDKTTISRTLRTLESKGYIKRDTKSIDKRTNFIKLTSLGEEVLEKSSVIVKSFRKKISSELSEKEKVMLFELLDRVLNPINGEK